MSLEPIMESCDFGIGEEEEKKEEEASEGDDIVGSGSRLSRFVFPPKQTGVRAGFMSSPDDDGVHECAARRCDRDIGQGAECLEATVALPEVAGGSGDAMSQLLAQYPEPAPKRVLTATE